MFQPKFPSSGKNRHYLSWIAKKLNEDNDRKAFELSTFQPNHLTKPKLLNFVFASVYVLVVGLLVGLGGSLVVGLVFGLVLGLFTAPEELETEDLRKWYFPSLFIQRHLGKVNRWFGLWFGLWFGRWFGLEFGLWFGRWYGR